MMPSPIAALMPLLRRARTQSCESPRQLGLLPETKQCDPRDTSVGRSGENGVDITVGAVSRRRCYA
ncbi:MAG: hypothetical protein ACI9BH_001598 [Paracoccaceae bacterium]|jgi:hypothetical protein